MLERYGHGGDLRTAEEAFGRPAGTFLDFSSNMNPFGPPDQIFDVIRHYANSISQYPDPAVRHLRSMLAQRHGVSEASVLVGNGAAELIDLAVRVVLPARTALAVPCFTEYGDAIRKSGGKIITVKLDPDRNFKLESQDLTIAGDRPDAWFLGSPNNPTGQTVEPSILHELLEDGRFVFLDEAFMDFLPDEKERSFAKQASELRNLLVIRSMTKFYAVPGIRLGYVIGHPERIAAMRELQIPWSVNSLAQDIGEAALEDAAFADRTIAWLKEERPALSAQLSRLGLRIFAGETNYVLFALPKSLGIRAAGLQAAMGKRGILIRDASHFDGLDESYCRVAVKLREDNNKLIAALAAVLAEAADNGNGGAGG